MGFWLGPRLPATPVHPYQGERRPLVVVRLASIGTLHCRVRGTSAAIDGRTPTPAIDLVNLKTPATPEPEARNFTALGQPVDG
jgi:hypothetical protein